MLVKKERWAFMSKHILSNLGGTTTSGLLIAPEYPEFRMRRHFIYILVYN